MDHRRRAFSLQIIIVWRQRGTNRNERIVCRLTSLACFLAGQALRVFSDLGEEILRACGIHNKLFLTLVLLPQPAVSLSLLRSIDTTPLFFRDELCCQHVFIADQPPARATDHHLSKLSTYWIARHGRTQSPSWRANRQREPCQEEEDLLPCLCNNAVDSSLSLSLLLLRSASSQHNNLWSLLIPHLPVQPTTRTPSVVTGKEELPTKAKATRRQQFGCTGNRTACVCMYVCAVYV